MVKYVDNTWHALKVAFGNEIGMLAKALNINSHEVMDIFFEDQTPQYFVRRICGRDLRSADRACQRICARSRISRASSTFRSRFSITSSTATACWSSAALNGF